MRSVLKPKIAWPRIANFPILAREWRSRFRADQTFLVFAFLCVGAVWAMIHRLNAEQSVTWQHTTSVQALAPLSQDLLFNLAWIQILGICLLSPLTSSPAIARERESGVTDDLLLTSLSPLRLTLEKWGASGGFLLVVLLALWPLDLIALLMGHSAPSELWALALLGVGCLAWGNALGLAFSAHARRAVGAARSSLGVSMTWLIGSFICAFLGGEVSFAPTGGLGVPIYLRWFGRTNPILCALDLLQPSLFLTPKWPYCAAFLGGGTLLLLWRAERGLRKPLPEAPIITLKRGKRGGMTGVLSRLELPFLSHFAPDNPILGRETRGKFRLRQPPLPVLIAEVALALGVAVVYVYLTYEALTDPFSHPIIFFGIVWVGFFCSALAASAQGGAALARERENGTWEPLRLSLLSPAQIVGGKLIASLGTMLVLSLPAWPLLLLCVEWGGTWQPTGYTHLVQPFQLVAALCIWLGTMWLQTTLGLLISTRASKAGSAIVMTAGLALIWMLGTLFLFVINASDNSANGFLSITNPLMALGNATQPSGNDLWTCSGWPFAAFAFVVGLLLVFLTQAEVMFQLQTPRRDN